MSKFELVDHLISELGLCPQQMIAYWQRNGVISSEPEKESTAPEVPSAKETTSPAPKPEPRIEIPDDDKIFIRMKQIIAKKLDVKEEDIKPETLIQEGLKADSLDAVELVMKYEEEFGLSIPDDAAERFKKVQDAWLYISRHAKV